MKIKEKNIKRLTIEYSTTEENDEREKVYEFLDNKFGRYNYRITRAGPKLSDDFTADMKTGKIIIEVEV